MLSQKDREDLRKLIWLSAVIWLAIALAVGMYVLIGHLGEDVLHGVSPIDKGVLNILRAALLGSSLLILLIIVPFLRKVILRVVPVTADASGPLPGAEPYVRMAAKKYLIAMIVTLALCESIAVFGFVLFILGDSFTTLYVSCAGSLLGMSYYYPKLEALEGLALELRGKERVFS